MALSDTAIRVARAASKQCKLHDESGLFLIITPSGGKLERLKRRHPGNEPRLSIGRDPEVSLKEARERRDEARKLIAIGKTPTFDEKPAAVAASSGATNTVAAIAEALFAKREREGPKGVTTERTRCLAARLLNVSSGGRGGAEGQQNDSLSLEPSRSARFQPTGL